MPTSPLKILLCQNLPSQNLPHVSLLDASYTVPPNFVVDIGQERHWAQLELALRVFLLPDEAIQQHRRLLALVFFCVCQTQISAHPFVFFIAA